MQTLPWQPIKFFFCFLLIFSGFTASATVFTVTSNADSGPGTLRQALLDAAANGTATKDYIYFNLPDQSAAGRTITVVTGLPNLSSNLIIDGSTQQGAVFGKSDAKIKITTARDWNAITVFNGTNIDSFELYGLYIHDYTDTNTSSPAVGDRNCFVLINGTNITIGGVGKGNMVRGFKGYGFDLENIDKVRVQSNVLGLDENNTLGSSPEDFGPWYTGPLYFSKCNNILLGGNASEGNIIFSIVIMRFAEQTNSNAAIKSNNFLVYQDGKSTEWYLEYYSFTIAIQGFFNNSNYPQDYPKTNSPIVNLDISDNVTGCQLPIFNFEHLKGKINITHNYFNVARDGVTNVAYNGLDMPAQYPLRFSEVYGQVNIGGDNESLKNYFNNVGTGISAGNVANIYIRKNDYRCVYDAAYTNYNNGDYTLPQISIDGVSSGGGNTTLKGKTEPNAIVEVYSSENCKTQCSIRSLVQTVNADAGGNWQASLLNLSGVFYASATVDNRTSQFVTYKVNSSNAIIGSLRCTDKATITGLTVPQGLSYYWTDKNGNIVSHNLDLVTSTPGDYRLVLGEGCITSDWFTIQDNRLNIYDGGAIKTNASCGNTQGGIKGLFVYDPLGKVSSTVWTDSEGHTRGLVPDIDGLEPGTYKLTATSTDGCSVSYTLKINNTTGPNIDQSAAVVTPTACGTSNGSITGIKATGTGTLSYSWQNAAGTEVATTPDLVNMPAGSYKLRITDQSGCDAIYSTNLPITEVNGITIDDSQKLITQASCQSDNGSIKNIKTPNATHYQWYTDLNVPVTTLPDLVNAAPGNYYLVASNATCSKTSPVYTISRQSAPAVGGFTREVKNATCDENNGSIQIIYQQPPATLPAAYRWANHTTGATITTTTTPILNGLDAGNYDIYAVNASGCETFMITYSVLRIPGLTVVVDDINITDSKCDTKTGSVTGIKVTGASPLSFVWTDAAGNTVGTNPNLENVLAGTYMITITDGSGCSKSFTYTVNATDGFVPPPTVTDARLCGPGNAIINVNNPSSDYKYKLYDDVQSATPLANEASGRFNINITKNRTYYISQYQGNCESQRVAITVSLGITNFDIANTFTPNGDGHNDEWKIAGIENYANSVVQVFNRYGEKVFEAKGGYNKPFDGTRNGRNLPGGTYYYIINLNSGCSLLSGYLAIIR